MHKTLRIGTRRSQLALWQAEHVAQILHRQGFHTELVAIETKGDKILDRSLAKVGSKGLFTEELETLLRTGDIHMAVHSAKDVASQLPDDLELIAFTQREAAHDVLISLQQKGIRLQDPLRIGTSSTRRKAFIKRFYPQWQAIDIRGNLQTRIRKMTEGQCDALLLAYAGVHRMGYDDMIVHNFPIEQFTPPVGQGSLAIQVHKDTPKELKEKLRTILNHIPTEHCLLAERALLAELQGGCSIPVFGYACPQAENYLLRGGVLSLDGKNLIQGELYYSQSPAVAGKQLARQLILQGADHILQSIRLNG